MAARILICNLTRFGDLLQTQPLINDLKNAGHHVSLLCLEDFASATALMRHLDMVYPFPGTAISSAIGGDWSKAMRLLLDFRDGILKQNQPDNIINLTPTPPGRLLSALLAQKGTGLLGFGLDSHGFGQNNGVWASFIAAAAHDRRFATFNLADMQRRLVHPLTKNFSGDFELAEPTKAACLWAANFIKENTPAEARPSGFACFQPGASETRRRWPLEHFARLGQTLWERARICPILTGSPEENDLAEKYAKLARHPFINAIGKTSLEQLAALLKHGRLLITNDTGTMHMAAGLGVASLSFFLATAQPWDTGPMLPGCCCLEPNLDCHPCAFSNRCDHRYLCRSVISPQTATDLVLAWLESGSWLKGVTSQCKKECRVWITAKDENGMSRLIPVSGQEQDPSVQWMNLMRDFWSQLLDELDGISHKNQDGKKAYPCSRQASSVLAQSTDILRLLVKGGATLGINPKGAKTFLKNCQRLQSILDICQPIAGIGAFWREFQQNQGADLKFFLHALKIMAGNFQWLRRQLSPEAPEN